MTDALRDDLQSSLGTTYTIERELGGGGMARVFIARDNTLNREVVVKVLPPDLAASVSIERFKREIALAARLQHPHIVPLFSAGDANGLPYFTMPYVEGESLRARIASKGELPVNEAMRVMREVASALDYAHEKGVVHRDIKPDNVLLSRGSAMVTDFGVAKALSASTDAENSGMTSLGVALGTPAYMAPEQASADPQIDHRADVYAFGVLAYELLTGHPPFEGRTPQGLLAAHVTENPEHVTRRRSTIPPALGALVMRCLEKRASDRPQTAGEIVHALDAITTPSGGSQPTTAMRGDETRAAESRRSRLPLFAALAALVLIAGGAGAWWRSRHVTTPVVSEAVAQRVAVARFLNKSGDASLDAVGDMAADWIARGLAGTGIVDVAGTAAELESRAGVKISAGAGAVAQLGREARAGIVISGGFYKQGDSIYFQADFNDVAKGKLVQSVGPVAALASRPLDGVERLRQVVTGGLASMLDSTLAGSALAIARPPSYEAYREFLRGEQLFYTDQEAAVSALRRAAALDSNYVYPQLRLVSLLSNMKRWTESDSLARWIEKRRSRLSAYESAYLDYNISVNADDTPAQLDATQRMHAAAPSSAFPLYLEAYTLTAVGDGRRAVAILDSLDPMSGALRGRVYYYDYLGYAFHLLGQSDSALAAARRGRAQYPTRRGPAITEALALAALGRGAEVVKLLDWVEQSPPDLGLVTPEIVSEVLWEARSHDRGDATRQVAAWAQQYAERAEREVRVRTLIDVYTATEQWNKLQPLADSAMAQFPTDPILLSSAGIAAAKLGNASRAQAIAQRMAKAMDALPPITPAGQMSIRRDEWLRSRADVAAAMGQLDEAYRLLHVRSGDGYSRTLYHDGITFTLMCGYPPFQAMIAPRG